MEAGGHIGKLTTMTLVRQVAAAVSIPVIAAGGIADGEGVAAGFMLGAEAVQVGTRFVVAKESNAHPHLREQPLWLEHLLPFVKNFQIWIFLFKSIFSACSKSRVN